MSGKASAAFGQPSRKVAKARRVVVHDLPPPHPKSASRWLGWIKARWNIAVQALFWEAVFVTVGVLLWTHGHYNWKMFTEWQWTYFIVLYFPCVFIGEVIGGPIQSFTALVLDPLSINTSRMVAIIITLIIATSPIVYVSNTTCVGGPTSIGLVRLFDWVLHGLTILAVYSLHASGYNAEVKFQVTLMVRALHWIWTAVFSAWVLSSTILVMSVYMLVENPIHRYHPDLKLWQLVLIGVAAQLFLAGTWLLDLFSDTSRFVGTLPFYSEKQLQAWEATNNQRRVRFAQV